MEDRQAEPKSNGKNCQQVISVGKSPSKVVTCQNCQTRSDQDCSCQNANLSGKTAKTCPVNPKSALKALSVTANLPPPQCTGVSKQRSAGFKSVAEDKPRLQDICLIHNKPLQIVCTGDLAIICSSCAIFGHKGHDFKSLNQFQTDKLERCQQILELTDGKKALDERVAGRSAKEKVDRQFAKLKEELLEEVRWKFRRLREVIDEAEDKCVQRVAEGVKGEVDRLRALQVVPAGLTQTYRLWEVHAYEEIKAFENDQELALQMKMLNYDRRLTEDIIKRGNTIINEMKNYQAELANKIQEALTSLTVVFNDGIEKQIQKLADGVVRRRGVEGLISQQQLSSEDMLLEDTGKQNGLEDRVLDIQSNVASRVKETTLPGQRRRSLGQQLSELSMQQPTFFMNDHQSNANPPEQKPRLTTQPDNPPPEPQNTRKRMISAQQQFQRTATVTSSSAIQPSTASSYLKQAISPQKLGSCTSIRSALSPTKYKQLTAQTRVKKVLSKLKLPQKYQKLVSSIMSQSIDTLDLSNCSIDQTSMICIIQLLKVNKSIKCLKLIRNRLTDDFLERILPFIVNVSTLNLSQNYLTERSLDCVMAMTNQLTMLRHVVLSQNRIREKTCRGKLEELKKMNITVTF